MTNYSNAGERAQTIEERLMVAEARIREVHDMGALFDRALCLASAAVSAQAERDELRARCLELEDSLRGEERRCETLKTDWSLERVKHNAKMQEMEKQLGLARIDRDSHAQTAKNWKARHDALARIRRVAASPPSKGQRATWSETDIATLRRMVKEQKQPMEMVAAQLGRSPEACRSKMRALLKQNKF